MKRLIIALAVVAFTMPYGLWPSSVGGNMKICGEALRNAGFLGGAEGAGNSCEKFGLPSNVWVGAYVFAANDKNPDRVAFGKGFRTGIARIDKGETGLTGPRTFARSAGELRVSDDRSKFTFGYRNSTGSKQDRVEFILRLPAGYEPGIVRKALKDVKPGVEETMEFQSRPPSDSRMLEGVFYAALEINFPGARMWAQLMKQ